jgi:hypothetical protein
MKRKYQRSVRSLVLLWFVIFGTTMAVAQSGGTFELEQIVIAPGGMDNGGTFSSTNVIGQTVAAAGIRGGRFQINTGFLATSPLVPTAAGVTLSGRALTAAGRPIGGVRISLLNSAGVVRTALTSQFGYFRLDGVTVGETYILTAVSKEHEFTPQVISVGTDIADLELISLN